MRGFSLETWEAVCTIHWAEKNLGKCPLQRLNRLGLRVNFSYLSICLCKVIKYSLPKFKSIILAIRIYAQVISCIGLPRKLCFKSGFHKAQWLTMERTFVLKRALLKCNLKPFVASISIPLLCSWLTAMFLFSKLTDFNFPGNSGIVRVTCVALQVTGPRRNDQKYPWSAVNFQNSVSHNWSYLPRALPDIQITCVDKMIFCPRDMCVSFRGTV